jgi:seryl-tRNA synthetase
MDQAFYNDVIGNQTVERDQIELEDQFLTPAVCLHLYPMLEGKKIEDMTVTMFGRAYRYENGRFDGLIRLWDYAIREIVFIGSPQYVKEKLQEIKEETKKMVKELGLPANIEKANDHFYPSDKNKIRERIQIVNSTKDELVVPIHGKEVAISSFNYHGTNFSKVFHFDNENSTVTGCVGYGLERWVAAINEYNIDIKNFTKIDR